MTRIAIVKPQKCHPQECQELCLRKCPVNKMDEPCITIGENGKAVIEESLCVGCGICPRVCPYNALDIVNLPQELHSKPIHRYAENAFALYNLPVPLFGKVIGLLGRNGIGKSTAMKILAGVIRPNFENPEKGYVTNSDKSGVDKESTIRDLVQYFKGSEAQGYFEKLEKGEIIISYKPQQVELIPRSFSGTVKDLLLKVDQKGEFERITELLELVPILDRDITQVSGGELQRVAIAACVLKKANVYFFDEPTSYLDIKQRLKIAKFIRSLADEKTAVVVIEHDLIILDYLADFIHLLYGKESAYGIVSTIRPTKNGINTYLAGYLRDENIRFRDHEIKFDSSGQDEEVSMRELFTWNAFEKHLGSFHLQAKKGTVHRKDVVGVLGENGIGKTSFFKELVAGTRSDLESVVDIEAEETIIDLRVAYKPQYIESSDELVRTYLAEALRYEIQLMRPLYLESLLDLTLDELSGGELQRVVIAKTLAQDADIYLLDEPSAYLDVEQRLSLSKVVRDMLEIKKGSAIIIDHDLLFMDHVSKRLLVFDGVPAIKGEVTGPFKKVEGMFAFLDDLDITFRRDETNHRPRVNKLNSQKDKEQKASGNLYYC